MVIVQVIEGNNGGSSSRTAVINRPSSLNAINNPMVSFKIYGFLSLCFRFFRVLYFMLWMSHASINLNFLLMIIELLFDEDWGTISGKEVLHVFLLVKIWNEIQAVRLRKLYREWEDDPDIGFVMLKVFIYASLINIFIFPQKRKGVQVIYYIFALKELQLNNRFGSDEGERQSIFCWWRSPYSV